MTEIEGDLPFFEGAKVSGILGRRVLGLWRYAWPIAYVAVLAGGGIFGVWLASQEDEMSGRVAAILAGVFLLAIVVLLFAVRHVIQRAIRRRWHARGVPQMGHVKIVITPEALRIEAHTATTIVPWDYVSEVIFDRRYLLFVVAGLAYFVPRRFFESPEQEAAFTAEALARLTPAARARSEVPLNSPESGV